MSSITFDRVAAKTPGDRTLFEGLTLAIGDERVGLVGRNGAGKSTLLHLIAGRGEPSSGSISISGRVGELAQRWPDDTITLAEALGVADGLARLERLARGDGSEEDMAEADWMLEHRIGETLAKVDLPERDLTRTIKGFSGGERTRIAIARLWLEAPEILLLDEPTNNLDASGRAAILALIDDWRGAAFVASHDRNLLEHVDRIVELTPIGVTLYGGGWSAFAAAREARRASAEGALDKAEADLRRVKDQVQLQREMKQRKDAAGKAGRFAAGQSKMMLDFKQDRAEASQGAANRLADRQLTEANEALDKAKAQFEVIVPLNIVAPSVYLPSQKLVLSFEDVTAQAGGRPLFGPLTFKVTGPERIHVVGSNGAGKSTLLKLIMGQREPASGSIRRLDGRIAMLDQHAETLDDDKTLLENMRAANPELDDNAAYAGLARFAFRNKKAHQVVATLSGGERLRAELACLLAATEPPQLLLLDEPTNHLDIDSIELIEAAMRAYDGALAVVSHDPAFVEAIGCTREIVLG
ncbi:MAG: ABC-F family ATP-binding cassette domain-containing protein [Alphaproteobacteria bacterium]|jgi:ATPase subunit of ABC transporter with duplicated ATPase domains|nr:MAG: ABC-F family ATP-binding cassette domain-containing protein [Alphaproteobacteria bacterium]